MLLLLWYYTRLMQLLMCVRVCVCVCVCVCREGSTFNIRYAVPLYSTDSEINHALLLWYMSFAVVNVSLYDTCLI